MARPYPVKTRHQDEQEIANLHVEGWCMDTGRRQLYQKCKHGMCVHNEICQPIL